MITASTEHPAVLDACRELEREGFAVTYLAVEKTGEIPTERVREAMTDRTILVSLMLANNEIGTIHPIARDRRALPRARRPLPHRRRAGLRQDPVRRRGHERGPRLRFGSQDLRSQGCRRALRPLAAARASASSRSLFGGGQEHGVRSGTLNVPGIVGLGKAAEIAVGEMDEEARRLRQLRRRLHDGSGAAGRRRHQRRRRCRRSSPTAASVPESRSAGCPETSTSPSPASTARRCSPA